ncbi:hypothetical protein HJC23_002442 [Cyclotella cryptica]|uniref:HSF-type DNA-binding domain-containing protein n=1 Tax=Cyclotella cryptica TaxID=29204 RepID=A0ABD3PX37_9STRA|eukprot:CCRYP_011168-RA/>CCRYP_011168-RA protein AED:0.52 eAED:0.48 QI:0/0/0/0.66/1/1/3/0/514
MMNNGEGESSQTQCTTSAPTSQNPVARSAQTDDSNETASSPNITVDVKIGTKEPKPKKKREMKSAIVDHTYHDYANHPFQSSDLASNRTASRKRHKRERKAPSFPSKLHRILSTPEYKHIIAWLPHGRSWTVLNKELLVSVVLKDHFSHNNFESFNRQINLWGFKRLLRSGPDYKSYYHEAFLRGRPDLIPLVQRLQNEGKRIPNIKAEPNFYEMPFLPIQQTPHSGMTISPAAGANAHVVTQGNVSSDSIIRGRAGSHQQFEEYAISSSCSSQNNPGSVAHFQQSQAQFSFPAGSGISNQFSRKTGNPNDLSYQFRGLHYPRGDLTSFQRTEAVKNNVRQSADWSPMESAYQFPPAIERKEPQSYKEEMSDMALFARLSNSHDHNNINTEPVSQNQERNQWNVKSAMGRRITSYSSGNMATSVSTAPSFSGRDSTDFEGRSASHSNLPSESCESDSISAGPNQDQDQRAKSIHNHVPLARQSIELLSNPPNDPVLEEFAKEYLPHFGDTDDIT